MGAANNTLMYIDNIRLLAADDTTTGISQLGASLGSASSALYDLQGRRTLSGDALRKGLYIQNGQKVVIQ